MFKYIVMDQICNGNIKKVRGKCKKGEDKKLYVILKRNKEQNALRELKYLITKMQTGEEEEMYFDILERASYEANECASVMEMLYALEESGEFSFDVDKEEISININGIEPKRGTYGELFYDISNIQDNPNLSNVFAMVGPTQDLSNKIHNDNDARKAAKTFSEGRKSLEDLLYFCITKGIKTFTCCAGHKKNLKRSYNDGYISFNIDDEFTRNAVKYLNTKLEEFNEDISVDENCDKILAEGIYCNYETADYTFSKVLENLQEYISRDRNIEETIDDNETNKRINYYMERRNNPALRNIPAFIAVMNSDIRLSQVQDETGTAELETMENKHDDKELDEI